MAQGKSTPVETENFEKIGSPTIVDGWMTPSSTSWIQTPQSFNPGTSPWVIQFEVKKTGSSGYQNMISSGGVLVQSGSNNAQHRLYLKSVNGSSYDISNGSVYVSVTNQVSTIMQISYDGTTYRIKRSEDGGASWSTKTVTSSLAIKAGKIVFGPKASNTNAFAGSFNLRNMEIWINGVSWWTPYVYV